MNRKMVFNTVGRIVLLEAALLLLPLAVAFIYGEMSTVWAFAAAAGVAVIVGGALALICRMPRQEIFAKEGFVTVALAWVIMSLIGALPFVLNGDIPNYVDAVFETVSGFTTTGSSILTDVETLSHGSLFWRSFTHWIGGMGVLVLIMAIAPTSGRSIHVMRAEMPGPIVGKLVPRIRDTAKILYRIYIVMTAVEVVLLLFGGMDLFESAVHAFGTAGTGGFGIKADGLAGYNPYCQWVIAVFMLLFGVNFNLYYLILIGHFRSAIKSRELWVYGFIALAASAMITVNILPMETYNGNVGHAARDAVFQVASIVTTTGYSTTDFNLWPSLSRGIIFILLFMGGCAGSTAGGLKVSRVMLLFKAAKRDVKRLVHPRSVDSVKLEGKRVDDNTVSGTLTYFVVYFVLLAVTFLILSFENFGTETNLTAAITCLNNVGPGLGAMVGPAGSFAAYSPISKIVLTLAMLFGRLEIYPVLITLIPSTWTKK